MKGPADVTGQELFQSLSVDAVQKINDISEVKTYEPGTSIFEPNQDAKNVYLMLDGLVALRFPGKEDAFSAGLVRIEKNDLLGAGALLGSPKYVSQAYCVENSTVMVINGRKLREILEEDRIVGFDVVMKIADLYFERYVNVMRKIQSIFL